MSRASLLANWHRRGRPRIADSDADRCHALTVMTEWKIRNKREQRCPFVSKFTIDGKDLCRHHTVMECMAIMLEAKRVRPIPRLLPRPDGRVQVIQTKGKRK